MRFFPILLVTILLGLRDPLPKRCGASLDGAIDPPPPGAAARHSGEGSLKTIFLFDNNRREAVKCAQTDSNQAEDICPARFFATSEPANHRIDLAGKRKEES